MRCLSEFKISLAARYNFFSTMDSSYAFAQLLKVRLCFTVCRCVFDSQYSRNTVCFLVKEIRTLLWILLQVMLNSPKRIEAEKAKMAQKEKEREKEAKTPAKANTVNGTGGTPIHVNTLQVNKITLITFYRFNILFGNHCHDKWSTNVAKNYNQSKTN